MSTSNKQRYVALYERLSRDDENQGESNSITNQKNMLEMYAKSNGMIPFKHFFDDGVSGTTFDRKGFQEMIAEAKKGNISAVVVKDMSRFGRDYLKVGYYTEVFFPDNDIRFIAVSNSIDSLQQNSSDFTPFLNIMNEWYARDASRKIQAVFKSRMQAGKRVSPSIPYGYLRSPEDKQKLIIDDEAADVVRRIFRMAVDGKGTTAIARQLEEERVLIPSAYAAEHCPENQHCKNIRDKYHWTPTTIGYILSKQEYLGHTILGKSVGVSYKSKKRKAVPQSEQLVFRDTHPAIIDEDTWNLAQKLKKKVKRNSSNGEPPHALSGLMYCADCGKPMNRHINITKDKAPRQSDYAFVCSGYRNHFDNCSMHYIKICDIEALVLDRICQVSKYAIENEGEFIKRVEGADTMKKAVESKRAKSDVKKAQARIEELNTVIKKLYESNALGKIPDDLFDNMFSEYNTELQVLKATVAEKQSVVDAEENEKSKSQRFLKLVKKYTCPTKLTATIANEFIDKIIVHECVKKDGKKSKGHRTQKVDIVFNFIGEYIVEQTEEEILAAELEAQRQAELQAEERRLRRNATARRYRKNKKEREQAAKLQIA